MNSDKTIDIYKTPILYVDDEQDNITSFLMDFEDYFNIYTGIKWAGLTLRDDPKLIHKSLFCA